VAHPIRILVIKQFMEVFEWQFPLEIAKGHSSKIYDTSLSTFNHILLYCQEWY